MNTIYMMVGIPGCGKTTFSKKLSKRYNCEVISTDIVRKNNPDWTEELIWPEVYRLCADYINNNKDVIFDATSITPKVRRRFIDAINEYNITYKLVAYYIDTNWERCLERVKTRNRRRNELYLPPEVVENYAKRLIAPQYIEGFSQIYAINNNTKKPYYFLKIGETLLEEGLTYQNINHHIISKLLIIKDKKLLLIKNNNTGISELLGGIVKLGESLEEPFIQQILKRELSISKIKPFGYIEEYNNDLDTTNHTITYYFKAQYEGEPFNNNSDYEFVDINQTFKNNITN